MATNDETAAAIIKVYAAARVSEDVVFMTYGELSDRLGRPGQQRLLGDPLDRVRKLCESFGIPDIATVIVDKVSLERGTLKPSERALEKYGGWRELRVEQARVLAFDWASFHGLA